MFVPSSKFLFQYPAKEVLVNVFAAIQSLICHQLHTSTQTFLSIRKISLPEVFRCRNSSERMISCPMFANFVHSAFAGCWRQIEGVEVLQKRLRVRTSRINREPPNSHHLQVYSTKAHDREVFFFLLSCEQQLRLWAFQAFSV